LDKRTWQQDPIYGDWPPVSEYNFTDNDCSANGHVMVSSRVGLYAKELTNLCGNEYYALRP
jgi:hypothetical protein